MSPHEQDAIMSSSIPPNQYSQKIAKENEAKPASANDLAQIAAPIFATLWKISSDTFKPPYEPPREELIKKAIDLARNLYAEADRSLASSDMGKLALDAIKSRNTK
jgi:hypothetical protein